MGKITCIVSGGQTGADQGALEAARELGLEIDGFAPANYETETGPNPALLRDVYKLKACAGGYGTRDRANCDLLHEHDIVVAFRLSRPMTGAGTDKTLNYVTTGRYEAFERPLTQDSVVLGAGRCFVVWDLAAENVDARAKWLRSEIAARTCDGAKLLVSGPCESTLPGFAALVRQLLVQALA